MTAPARPLAWTVLVASGLSVLIAGLIGTRLILGRVDLSAETVPPAFWRWFLAGCGLTVASLGLRALRWVFLMRRAQVRIPIRDSFIGYFSGLTLLFAPFLLGEMALRAFVHRSRAGVPVAATCVINLWERYLDLMALAVIAVAVTASAGPMASVSAWTVAFVALIVMSVSRIVRELVLTVMVALTNLATRHVLRQPVRVDRSSLQHLTAHGAWLVALGTSVAAWTLPSVALWGLARSWGHTFSVRQGLDAYATSALTGGFTLAPGGILVMGGQLLGALNQAGFPDNEAALTALAIRVATAGLATALGGIFLCVHFASRRAASDSHFDAIAHEYDAQIPEARRFALLAKKTDLMRQVLASHAALHRGLDVGCGQGWHVTRMRQLGFDVRGIDESAGQVATARRHADDPETIAQGSVLRIPAPAATYDFVYCINVLHHLDSVRQQQEAFAELTRVLRPGGLLFVHEINTRNILFRFYMGYVFPALNCIDEGVERWLLPHRLETYSSAPVIDTRYFTFLPDFLPDVFLRLLGPLERLLERSRLRRYSAHYMAVLQRPE